jgi:Leucine-rich repeat (LRR) protein
MSRPSCLLLAVLVLCGCADYRFTVNERVIYNPAPLFSAFDVPDRALRDCIRQHIADASITAAEQLNELNCSHAGVSKLDGLPVFTRLVRLKLSNNAVEDLAPLVSIGSLSELYLDANRLRNIMPLRSLLALEYLNLEGNDQLVCQQLEYFRRQPGLELVSPAHCGP